MEYLVIDKETRIKKKDCCVSGLGLSCAILFLLNYISIMKRDSHQNTNVINDNTVFSLNNPTTN